MRKLALPPLWSLQVKASGNLAANYIITGFSSHLKLKTELNTAMEHANILASISYNCWEMILFHGKCWNPDLTKCKFHKIVIILSQHVQKQIQDPELPQIFIILGVISKIGQISQHLLFGICNINERTLNIKKAPVKANVKLRTDR